VAAPEVLGDAVHQVAARGAGPSSRDLYTGCAERFGLDELVSEDFQDGRLYATVQVTNPFATGGAG
jgi:hypothetical protein